ncbi:unnamed protein product, partial [Chrysoparadoxa australica]
MKAYGHLLQCCHNIAFDLVNLCTTEELPEGDAHKAWTVLKNKYERCDPGAKVQLKTMFQQQRLEHPYEDPDRLFIRLEKLRSQLIRAKSTCPDIDIITQVFKVLNEQGYSSVITNLELQSEELTLQKVQDAIQQFYLRNIAGRGRGRQGGNRYSGRALYTANPDQSVGYTVDRVARSRDTGNGRFSKRGGRNGGGRRPYRQPPNGSRSRFKGNNCFICNKPGHWKNECPTVKATEETPKDNKKGGNKHRTPPGLAFVFQECKPEKPQLFTSGRTTPDHWEERDFFRTPAAV